jgi:iron-sulfur cluster repair protein YtfE (RIC family)
VRKSHKQKIRDRKWKRLDNKVVQHMTEQFRKAVDEEILKEILYHASKIDGIKQDNPDMVWGIKC